MTLLKRFQAISSLLANCERTCFYIGNRAVGRSENLGVQVKNKSNLTEEIQVSQRASDRGSYAKPLYVQALSSHSRVQSAKVSLSQLCSCNSLNAIRKSGSARIRTHARLEADLSSLSFVVARVLTSVATTADTKNVKASFPIDSELMFYDSNP